MNAVVGPSRSEAKEGKGAPNPAQGVTVSSKWPALHLSSCLLPVVKGRAKPYKTKAMCKSGKEAVPSEEPEVPEVPVGKSVRGERLITTGLQGQCQATPTDPIRAGERTLPPSPGPHGCHL